MVLLLQLLGVLVVLPVVLALFLYFNKNNRWQKCAVFFVAGVLIIGAVWAVAQSRVAFQLPTGVDEWFGKFVVIANLAVFAGIAYVSQLWKNIWFAGIGLVQVFLLGWIGYQPGWTGGSGAFLLDHLAILMLLLINGVGAVTLVFSWKFMETHEQRFDLKKSRRPLFFAITSLLLGVMNGLVLADHFLSWFLFWQIIVLGGFILIVHDRTETAVRNGQSFVNHHMVGGTSFLAGVVWLRTLTPSLSLSETLLFADSAALLAPLALFVLAGLAFSAQFPFQDGLIGSTVAPMPVAVLLQAATLANAGVYLIFRVSPLFMNTLLAKVVAVIGAFSFAAGALMAMLQHDTKRMLTFTTISVLGLILALASFASLQAIYLAALLFVLHGMAKALLFLSTGSYSQSRLPYGLTLLGALAMTMPPFGVTAAQWTAIEGSLQNPPALLLLVAGAVFSMLAWTRFIGKRWSAFRGVYAPIGKELASAAPQVALAGMVVLTALFLVPFANYFVAPILKENYGRFADIAQANKEGLSISSFSGIDPLYLFGALLGIAGLSRLLTRVLVRAAAAPGVEVELPMIKIKSTVSHDIWLLSLLPDSQKVYHYATAIAGALIILMFEVVIR